MSIPGSSSPLFFQTAAGGAGTFEGPAHSARFDPDNYNFLYRTPSSAGNRRKWTWAGWIKRSKLGAEDGVFSSYGDSHPNTAFVFNQNNTFQFHEFESMNFNFKLVSNRVFRDTNAWYHIIVAVDTTQSIAAYRIRIYINGTLLSSSDYSSAQWPDENHETDLNSATRTDIGYHAGVYFSGYMADIHFIDGQQLDHTDLGGFDSNGVWQAKDYTGTYGSNGYRINFSNVTSSASFGEDSSGNDNDHGVQGLRYVAGPFASYTSTLTASSGGFNSSHPTTLAFNGDQGTFAKAASAGASLTFTPSSSISYSSSVQTRTPTADSNVSINGGSASFAEGGNTWTTIASGSGSISSIVFNTTGGSDYMSLAGIKIDGEYLLDHTAGARTDLYRDSPVNGTQSDTGAGGEVTGNYASFNPLKKSAGADLSSGNLQAAIGTTGGTQQTYANFGMSSGKWFWEVQSTSGNARFWGIAKDTAGLNVAPGENASGYGWGDFHGTTGEKWHNGSYSSYGTYPSLNDIVGVAFDADNGTLTFYKNGVSQGTAFTGISGTYFPVVGIDNTTHILNAGQRPFAYSAPSGFSPLCTALLSTPTIADGSAQFETKLWSGNDAGTRDITTSFAPDFVWIKGRNVTNAHFVTDTVRGKEKNLFPHTTDAEEAPPVYGMIDPFLTNGFRVKYGNHGSDSLRDVNKSGSNYVGWAWNAGANSAASNTDGGITSSVKVNASAGFSIGTFTGTGSINTVGTGLSGTKVVILKNRSSTSNWVFYHTLADGSYDYMYLNLRNANASSSLAPFTMNNTFKVSTNTDTNASGDNYVFYAFSPVAGYCAMGKYIGNGDTSGEGPFVFTDFRPAFILIKANNSGGDAHWGIFDTQRIGYNGSGGNPILYPNRSTDEYNGSEYQIDILSNGFKLRVSFASGINFSSTDHYYIAFAENPFSANGGLAR